MNKAIFLDRDGVINYDSPDYIKSPEEFHFIPGSIEAIVKLNQAGYQVGIATNQSGLSRGYYDLKTLEAMHQKMRDAVESAGGKIHHIEFCPHLPTANCECRKPKPQMLMRLAEKCSVNISDVFFVGDKSTDMEAAIVSGAKPILIAEVTSQNKVNSFITYTSLKEFVNNM